jgi:hypothetical protein
MPKSRNRSRAPSRPAEHYTQRPWVKWLAIILPAFLVAGLLLGMFSVALAPSVK